jgi:hypothetical protein
MAHAQCECGFQERRGSNEANLFVHPSSKTPAKNVAPGDEKKEGFTGGALSWILRAIWIAVSCVIFSYIRRSLYTKGESPRRARSGSFSSVELLGTSEDLDTLDAASSSHFHHDTITEHAGMATSFKDGKNEEKEESVLHRRTHSDERRRPSLHRRKSSDDRMRPNISAFSAVRRHGLHRRSLSGFSHGASTINGLRMTRGVPPTTKNKLKIATRLKRSRSVRLFSIENSRDSKVDQWREETISSWPGYNEDRLMVSLHSPGPDDAEVVHFYKLKKPLEFFETKKNYEGDVAIGRKTRKLVRSSISWNAGDFRGVRAKLHSK